ncbi:MAG: ABC transporter substrate-binding protein [Pseudomonadota bacterium]
MNKLAGTVAGAAIAAAALGGTAMAQDEPIRIGVMLPYSGTFALLGQNITDAMELAMVERGNGGCNVEYIQLDSEADPSRGPENARRLIDRDLVDILVGPVHSGVAMGMVQVVRETGTPLIIPNAGARQATAELCAPNIFRTSFSNWQPAYPSGTVAYDRGARTAVTLSWDYGAGHQATAAFAEAFEAAGGDVVEELFIPFPDTNFQPLLTQIAGIQPDAVFVFFAGGGAVQFVNDYDAAGLKDTIPLYGSGFLTEGVLEAQGDAAEGLLTTLHYGDGLDNPVDAQFRTAFEEATGRPSDVYAVQGYDTGQLIAQALEAVSCDVGDLDALSAAMAEATIESPRGTITMSAAHNPVQDIYLREARDGENVVIEIAAPALEDPAPGCAM